MATSDIISELEQSDQQLDTSLQAQVSKAVLQQLDDGSTDVQTVAIKALAVLVKKISVDQLNDAIDKLTVLLLDDSKAESHDLYSIGLKTLISSVSEKSGQLLCVNLCKKLLAGLAQNNNTVIDLCLLDVLRDLITRFGAHVAEQHNEVVDQVCRRLEHTNDSIRKRSNQVIGSISIYLNDKLFDKVMRIVITKIEQHKHNDLLYTYLSTVSTLCSSAGQRIGSYLDQLMPPLQSFCAPDAAAASVDDEQLIQLHEAVLQAFESILLRCPVESVEHTPAILNIAQQFIVFDPNYAFGADDVAMSDDSAAGDTAGWDDDTANGSWSDDDAAVDADIGDSDDMSWLVRRGAARVLHAFIDVNNKYFSQYYSPILDLLTQRLNERDYNVKTTVISTLQVLLQHTTANCMANKQVTAQMNALVDRLMHQFTVSAQKRDIKVLLYQIFGIMIQQQLIQLNDTQIASLVDYITQSIQKSDEITLTLPGLNLLHIVLNYYRVQRSQQLIEFVVQLLNTNNYVKIQLVLLNIVKQLITATNASDIGASNINNLYASIYRLFLMNDLDNTIKNAVLQTIALVFVTYSSTLHSKFDAAVAKQFVLRYNNESTRTSCMKALTLLLSSEQLSQPVLQLYSQIEPNLFKQLQNKQSEKADVYEFYVQFVQNKYIGTQVKPQFVSNLLSLTLDNLHTHTNELMQNVVVLKLVHQLVQLYSQHIDRQQTQRIIDSLFTLISHTFMPDTVLSAVVQIYRALLQHNLIDDKSLYSYFVAGLSKTGADASGKAVENYAKVFALCSADVQTSQVDDIVANILKKLSQKQSNGQTSVHQTNFDLHILQYLKHSYKFANKQPKILDVLLPLLNVEHVQQAAAQTVGAVCTTDIQHYLPVIINKLHNKADTSVNKLYLFVALRSFLSHYVTSNTAQPSEPRQYLQPLVQLLLQYKDNTEEMIRNTVAENCAVLIKLFPELYTQVLEFLRSSNVNVQIIGIHTIKTLMNYTLTQPEVEQLSAQLLLPLIQLLASSTDLNVRKQVLLCITTVAHTCPQAIQPHIPVLLKQLYPMVMPDKSLVRTVDLGSFKHTIDDGLPVRKAVFGTLDTLQASLGQHVDMQEFCRHVMNGINDVDDISILTYSMLTNAAVKHGSAVVHVVDALPGHIMKAVKDQLKAAKVVDTSNAPAAAAEAAKQADNSAAVSAGERARDVLRATVRCIVTVNGIKSVDGVQAWHEFYQRVLKTPQLAAMITELNAA